MIRNNLKSLHDRIVQYIRALLDGITPDGRIVIVLVMLFIFGGISIYMTVTSIGNMGRNKKRHFQIEHIKHLDLHQKTDSITNNNNNDYE